MLPMNKKVKNVLELLKVVCPGCGEAYMHGQIASHISTCEQALELKAQGRQFETDVDLAQKQAQ